LTSICLDHLSLVDLTALELIHVATELECARVSLFVTPLPLSPSLDLVNDRPAKAEVLQALRAGRLGVGIVEPFMLGEEPDWPLLERSASLAAELGGTINALGFDPDATRLQDSMGRLATIAAAVGVPMTIEAYPLSQVRTQHDALVLAMTCGSHVGLCVDCLHVIRAGGGWGDVAALPPERIRHVQLNDGPLAAPDDRFQEAVAGRFPPGEGEFNLSELLPHLPGSAVIAVEAPFIAPAGMSPLDRGRVLVDATRRLLAINQPQ